MDIQINETQRRVRDDATVLSAEFLAPAAVRLDETSTFPEATLKELGRRGYLGINIDTQYGGLGAGVTSYVLAVRELAEGCAATTVAMMVTNMVAEAIQSFGDAAQKQRYLSAICSGDWPAYGFSLSEPGSGSDAAALRTIAVRDGDHYVLNGTKAWVTSGGHCGVYLVMASTDPDKGSRGISAFLVDPGVDGFSVEKPEDKMGLKGSKTTQLVFQDCRLPASTRLGREGIGFTIAMSSLDGGRVGVSAQACGIASAALSVAKSWAEGQGGDLNEETLAALATCQSDLDAGWLLCLRAAQLKDEGRPLTREAAVSKVYCTEMAGRVCARLLDLLGADLSGAVGTIERLARDARVTRIYEGTSEIQRKVIAREILNTVASGGKLHV